jgi:aspartyl-tRNA(Asn)/glutamyl-tRNA(Gln) amidotransferase subunit C
MSGHFKETTEGVDVRYVANLARLTLSDDEVELFQGQLEHILEYVEQLSELDVEGIEPTAHAVSVTNVFREDKAIPFDAVGDVPLNFPSSVQQLVAVPKIIE